VGVSSSHFTQSRVATRILNSQGGNSLGNVRVHSLTLSFTPELLLGSQPCNPLPWSHAQG